LVRVYPGNKAGNRSLFFVSTVAMTLATKLLSGNKI